MATKGKTSLVMAEHQTIESLDVDTDWIVETYRMAHADFYMSKKRETEFVHPVPLKQQEGVVVEDLEVDALCHNPKKDAEAAS